MKAIDRFDISGNTNIKDLRKWCAENEYVIDPILGIMEISEIQHDFASDQKSTFRVSFSMPLTEQQILLFKLKWGAK